MGKEATPKRRIQVAEMKITAAADQVHSQLVGHVIALQSQGRDWLVELREILQRDPITWTEAEVGVVKTFTIFGSQTLVLKFTQAQLETIALAEGEEL